MNNSPLSGDIVVSLASNLPGPLAAARLGQLGAQVEKIEPPAGDPFALTCPAWYEKLINGQQVTRLDLKSEAGQTHLSGLLTRANLLITSMRPEALRRLALDWEALHSSYPGLCQVAILGYPEPEGGRPGHDLTYQADAGLVTPPDLPRAMVADMAGAERAVGAALALLLERERTGKGAYREVSLFQVARDFALPVQYGLTKSGGIYGGGLPEYNLYESRSGWIAVAALEQHFRRRLFDEMGSSEYVGLQLLFKEKTAQEWESWAEDRDLPIAAVRNL